MLEGVFEIAGQEKGYDNTRNENSTVIQSREHGFKR